MSKKAFPRAAGAPWYSVKATRTVKAADAEATVTDIWIYDVIGDDWWDPSLTAKEFCQMLAALETDEIVLHMASPGGSVADGIAIYNALISHPAKITARIEGWTCSIATVVALAAEHIVMFDNVYFMIHNPWSIAVGNAEDMRGMAEFLDMVGQTMVQIYMSRCSKSEEDLQAALNAETYMTSEMATEWGFVDEEVAGVAAAACSRFDLKGAMGFEHPPAPVVAGLTTPLDPHARVSAGELWRDARAAIDGLLADDAPDPVIEPAEPVPGDAGDSASRMELDRSAALLARILT